MEDQSPPPIGTELNQPKRWGPFHVLASNFLWFVGGAVLSAGIVFLTGAVITYSMPREYLGRVRLQVQPSGDQYQVFRENTVEPLSSSFMATQRAVLTSKETLYRVVDELNLVKKWEDAPTRNDAYLLLSDKIEVEMVKGTDLIDVEVYHTDPHEAAELANTVARCYRERINVSETTRSSAALDMLNAQETLQAQKVEDARLKMVELIEKYKIVDLGEGVPAWATQDAPGSAKQILMRDKMQTLEAEQEIATIETQIETLAGLEGERLINEAVVLNVDGTLSSLYPEYQRLKIRSKRLHDSGLGEKHPDVVATLLQLKEVEEMMNQGAQATKSNLQTRLEIARQSLKNLEDLEQRRSEESTMDERKRYTQYAEAKRNYETQNQILTNMQAALLQEKVELTRPSEPIMIHEIAEPWEIPARPRVGLNLLIAAGSGILLAVPAGLLFAYLRHGTRSG